MSVDVARLFWHSKLSGSDLLVGLALADWADDEGNDIYPSFHRVAWKAKVSYKTVQRAVANLMALGVLEQVAPPTNKKPAEYRIVLEKIERNVSVNEYDSGWKPGRDKMSTQEHPARVDICGSENVHQSVKEDSYPLKERTPLPPDSGGLLPGMGAKIRKPRSEARDDPRFIEFYKAYPLHMGPDAAAIAFRAALTRATFEAIMAGVERYKAWGLAQGWALGCDRWKYPQGWLSASRWRDELPTITQRSATASVMLPGAVAPLPSMLPSDKAKLQWNDVRQIADRIFGRKSTAVDWRAVRDAMGLRQNILEG